MRRSDAGEGWCGLAWLGDKCRWRTASAQPRMGFLRMSRARARVLTRRSFVRRFEQIGTLVNRPRDVERPRSVSLGHRAGLQFLSGPLPALTVQSVAIPSFPRRSRHGRPLSPRAEARIVTKSVSLGEFLVSRRTNHRSPSVLGAHFGHEILNRQPVRPALTSQEKGSPPHHRREHFPRRHLDLAHQTARCSASERTPQPFLLGQQIGKTTGLIDEH